MMMMMMMMMMIMVMMMISWLGGRDFPVEGSFTWTDGTAWSYTNWKHNAQAGISI